MLMNPFRFAPPAGAGSPAAFDPAALPAGIGFALSNANRTFTSDGSAAVGNARSASTKTVGTVQFEVTITADPNHVAIVGWGEDAGASNETYPGQSQSVGVFADGTIQINGSLALFSDPFTTGQVVGWVLYLSDDPSSSDFYIDGVFQNTAATAFLSGPMVIMVGDSSGVEQTEPLVLDLPAAFPLAYPGFETNPWDDLDA